MINRRPGARVIVGFLVFSQNYCKRKTYCRTQKICVRRIIASERFSAEKNDIIYEKNGTMRFSQNEKTCKSDHSIIIFRPHFHESKNI